MSTARKWPTLIAASRRAAVLAIAAALTGCGAAPSPSASPSASASSAPATAASTALAQSTPLASATPAPATPSASAPTPTPAPTPAKILGTIAVPGNPNGMIAAYGSIWIASRHTATVYRIARTTGKVTARIRVADEPAYFADDGHAVWVVEQGAGSVARINPATDAVEQVVLPGNPGGPPVVGDGAIWQNTDAGVVEIDAQSRRIVGTITPPTPSGVAFADGLLWVAADSGLGVTRIDPRTLKPRDTVAGTIDATGMIAADAQSVWAASTTSISRLDPQTGQVIATSTVPPSLDGSTGILSGGSIWLQQLEPVGFARLSPASAAVGPVSTLPDAVTDSLWVLALGPHEVWVSDWTADAVYRVDPSPG